MTKAKFSFLFVVISNCIFFKVRTYLALIANNYPKIKEPVLPDSYTRFFYCKALSMFM